MRKWWWIPAVIVIIILVVPLVIPIPPLEGTVPVEQLADKDSRFQEVNGIQVHYKIFGEGEPVYILLHGFLASTFSWREVVLPMAEMGTVVVFDRPGFGLTERPLHWEGQNPYSPDAQVSLLIGLMDHLGIEEAILVGNSAGGSLAVYTTLLYPERVTALVLVDAAIYTGGGSPGWIQPLLRTPQARRLGPLFIRNVQNWGVDFGRLAWKDPTRITDEVWEGYMLPLKAINWDQALWEFTLASRRLDLDKRLGELKLPVLVITGDSDQIVPTVESVQLASELPNAELSVIPNCGHVPHEECPQAFMQAIYSFLEQLHKT